VKENHQWLPDSAFPRHFQCTALTELCFLLPTENIPPLNLLVMEAAQH
jgi:hypothetical protein